MDTWDAMNNEMNKLRRRVIRLENTNKHLMHELDVLGDVLSEPASQDTPAMDWELSEEAQQIPFVNHPVPGDKGWVTQAGKPIEILGFDEESGDVWVRFPTDPPYKQHKTYRYRAIHWERYWTKRWEGPDPGRHLFVTPSDDESEAWRGEVERLLMRVGDKLELLNSKVTDGETIIRYDLTARMEIFMRMTLEALSDLQMRHHGITTVRMTAFDPPLHHAAGGPRYIPPGSDSSGGTGYYTRPETLEDDD